MSFFKWGGATGRIIRKLVFFVIALFFLQMNVQVLYAPAYGVRENTKNVNDAMSPFAKAAALKAEIEARAHLARKLQNNPEIRYIIIIRKISVKYGVDPLLVRAIVATESNYNEKAVSHVGALGLMQLMPRTAKSLGVKDAFNPEHNIDGGVRYLKKLLDKFNGNVEVALAAYNAGIRNVRRYKGIPPYAETQNYIRKVCSLREQFKKEIQKRESELSSVPI